jgi:hypothetical protein
MANARHVAAVAVAFAAALSACAATPGAPPGPTACNAIYSQARCASMTGYAASRLRTSPDEITGISVLAPPTPEVRDGRTILQATSGGPNVIAVVTLRDGSTREVSMDCGGIPALQCQDDPQLRATSVTKGGYLDTPEGATQVPAPDARGLAAATQLHVARLDIPIDHDGHYAVRVGEARLPNGMLSVADFEFVSPGWPSDVTIADGLVALEVRSLDDPTRLFVNVHDHGWVEGAERVEGLLVFDVLHHHPGATLSIRDLVVR